jgi:hypothetical protein
MALQEQQQSEEEAVSGGTSAGCSDLCDPQKHVSSKVGVHWVLLDQNTVYSA